MKLYTEFEVKFAIDISRCQSYLTFDEVLEQLNPIPLPSDEEIEASKHPENSPEQELYNDGWEEGVKWLRDKIQGGNK